jgi:hypothetical protein
MPMYRIEATRETVYEFEIEATDEHDAEDQMHNLELTGDIETYAYDWYPLEVQSIEEEEEVE